MFEKFFKRFEEEEYFEKEETVDLVVEERRKEKFKKPLIYDNDFKGENEEPKQSSKQKTVVQKKPNNQVAGQSSYKHKRLISPISGLTEGERKDPILNNKPVRKTAKPKPSIITVISPFYGDYSGEKKKPETNEAVINEVGSQKSSRFKIKKREKEEAKLPTVEDNLRNIASIINEEKDQLKIIEERTGEFKFSFDDANSDQPKTLIDEIDDNMSLDELMSLYEKKFKD